jgi:hypothetical protein
VVAVPGRPQFSVTASVAAPYHENGEPMRLTYVRVTDNSDPSATYYLAPGQTASPTPVLLETTTATLTFTDPRSLPAGTRSYTVTVFQYDWPWIEVWVNGGWVEDWDWVDGEYVVVGGHWEEDHWDGTWGEREDWGENAQVPITFTLTSPTLQVTQAAATSTYQPGGTVTVSVTIAFPGEAQALGLDVMIPAGWNYLSGSGNEGGIKPSGGTTDFLEWAWTTLPASPVTFAYTLAVPPHASGAVQILGDVVLRANDSKQQASGIPLSLTQAP